MFILFYHFISEISLMLYPNDQNDIIQYHRLIMQKNENLEKDRLSRLKNLQNMTILGQPDLLTILKATTISSFLSHKKVYQKEQKFVFGLNFPTTAHLSSYVNDRVNAVKKGNKNEIIFKIKYYIFDVFKKIDFHIQINIPGSLEMRAYTLGGQPVPNADYQSAYMSSVLRSLYPYNYHPSTEIHGEIENYDVLSSFIKVFVPLAHTKYQLQIPEDLIEVYNLGIELIGNYLKTNSFWNLANVLKSEVSKILPDRAFILDLQLKQLKGDYKDIVLICAEELLRQNLQPDVMATIMEFQIRSLCKLGKKTEARYLGESVIRQGLDHLETWEDLLKLYFEEGDDRHYFKVLNTAINFSGEDITLREKLQLLIYPKKIGPPSQIEEKTQKGLQIASYPQFMIKFDYNFMEQETRLKNLHQILQKTQKEKPTSEILHRLDLSHEKQSYFQKFVALFQKQRGWNKLIEKRNQCFWLQNDYNKYQTELKKKVSDISYRFMNQSFTQMDSSTHNGTHSNMSKSGKGKNAPREQQTEQNDDDKMNQSFQGEFSDADSDDDVEIGVVAPCSKRVATKRVSREQIAVRKIQFVKIICSYNLQKIFIVAYNNLRLHSDIEKWSAKLDLSNIHQLSKQKKQLLGYIFLKKGFFHKSMLRYRKSQQSFKIARKCTNSPTICLISCYNLAKLYLQHNNIKGVQFYTVEIVRMLYALGVEQYHAVPTWAKEIIPYIIKNYGKAITKRLQDPLKQIVELWLRIDYKPMLK